MPPKNISIGDLYGLLKKDIDKLDNSAWEAIDRQAGKFLEHKNFKTLSEEALIAVLKRDSFGVQEDKVIAAVLGWADTKSKGIKGEERRELLKNVLPHIRFLSMRNAALATIIPEGLLTQTQALQAFIYVTNNRKNEGKSLPAPDALKGFSVSKRRIPDYRVIFDNASGRNCTAVSKYEAKRNGSYESTIRGLQPLPEHPVTMHFNITQSGSWSGALVIGVIEKKEAVSQTVYGAPAYSIDPWHSQIRLKTETKAQSGMNAAQSRFKESGDLKFPMTMSWKPGSSGGGSLSFTLDDKPIPAEVEIPSSIKAADLVPWFGIYGRTSQVDSLEAP